MSSKPENTFISGVHKHLPASVYHEKMANPYRGGTPDVWYSGPDGDLWVEYKFVVLPKRDETLIVPELSALQVQWLTSRHAEGRNVAVIIGCKDGGVWLPGLTWKDPLTTRGFKDRLCTRTELALAIKNLGREAAKTSSRRAPTKRPL